MIERRTKERLAIVGGGMLGMTLAHQLSKAGKNVTLFEASPNWGGLAAAWQIGDMVWDKHYHVTLLSDQHTRGLVSDLGLENEMRWAQTKTGFYSNGKFHSLSTSVDFLKFPLLNPIDKARLAGTILYASRIQDWKQLENIPVADWLTKLSGKRTFEKIWLPLLRAKLGENYKDTSAAFIWTTIARMYAARRSGMKKEMFGYMAGGYARILDTFARELFTRRVYLKQGNPVRQIIKQPTGHVTIQYGDSVQSHFDRVIVTAAAPLANKMLPILEYKEKQRLANIRYQGVVCASVVLKKALGPYYVTNITDSWVPFTGVIEMSALVDREEFNGNHLVYLPKYASPNDAIFDQSDERIEETFLNAIARMYPHFRREDVLAFKISRVRNVVALPTLQYSEIAPPMNTSVHGLYLVNSAQITNGTLNVNETVQLAKQSAEAILREQVEKPALRRIA
jgi:protoporphyrinogen oxidase